MSKLAIEIIGMVAVTIGLASLVPQLLKTWRTRSAGDLSTAWLGLQLVAYGFGFAYVLLLDVWASIVGHIVGGGMTALLLALKLRYGMPAGGTPRAAGSDLPGAT